MPDGFRFPLDHQFWIPLRANPLRYERLHGPQLYVFGRLARGVTMEQARGYDHRRPRRGGAETHERLRPNRLPRTSPNLTSPWIWYASPSF
jgi:hypothetical protein